jgi:ATP phosphoribosyltransferase regulatory subunit
LGDLRAEPLRKEVATVIDYFLDVSAAPKEALERVAMISKGARVDVGPALQALVRRFERLEQCGMDLGKATFATEFGRSFEYYSGLVFQIEVEDEGDTGQIAGGGRYDRLLAHFGAPRDVPAIGSAIHTERLLAAVERSR